jgi:hypothetical protein
MDVVLERIRKEAVVNFSGSTPSFGWRNVENHEHPQSRILGVQILIEQLTNRSTERYD